MRLSPHGVQAAFLQRKELSHSEDSLARGTGGSQQSSPKTSREISVREIYCSSYVCSIRIDDDAPRLWRRLASSLSLAKELQIVDFFLPASQIPFSCSGRN